MNIDPEDKADAIEARLRATDKPNPPDPPRKRKRKFNKKKPLDSPVDEAIAGVPGNAEIDSPIQVIQ